MSKKDNSNKGVNIYFILYIIALVLLIPSPKEERYLESNANDDNLVPQFESDIALEKSRLILSLSNENDLFKVNYADTVNIIIIDQDSNNESAKPMTSIENLTYDNTYTFEGEFSSRLFEMEEITQGSWRFIWKPMSAELSSEGSDAYNIVVAYGEQARSFSVNTILEDQSSLAVANSSAVDDSIQIALATQPTRAVMVLESGDFELIPSNYAIKALSRQIWQNTINLLGIDSDQLSGDIKLTSSDESIKVSIASISDKSIVIKGTTPVYKKANISVRARSKINGRTSETVFAVEPVALSEPILPTRMYPNVSYTLKPNLPELSDFDLLSSLVMEGDTLISRRGNGDITYTPAMSDTNKSVRLIRFVNGQHIGNSVPVTIQAPPIPVVVDANPINGSEILVRTRSFGGNDSKPLTILKLEVAPSPASVAELYGNAKDCGKGCFEQQFRVKFKNPTTSFSVIGVDELGRKSQVFKK